MSMVPWNVTYIDRFYIKSPNGEIELVGEWVKSGKVLATKQSAAQKRAQAALKKKHPPRTKTRFSWHEWELKSIERDR